MSAGLSGTERDALARLFDVLVPAAEGMPSASAAGVAGEMLDVVLNFRPDLRAPLMRILREARKREPEAYVRELAEANPESFRALGAVVAHGYYMAEAVRAKLGYPGQQRSPFDPDETPDYVANGLLQAVVDRGAIWRDLCGGRG